MERDFAINCITKKYQNVKMIVFTDLNEIAWKCYLLFKKMHFEICVVGEKWEWFGFKSGDSYLKYPEFQKLYIYSEGVNFERIQDERRLATYYPVHGAFEFLERLNCDVMKRMYELQLNRLLKKGVAVCECVIPSDVSNWTELERKCRDNNVSLDNYLDNDYKHKNEIEPYLFEIYGKNNILTIKKEGGVSVGGKGNYVPVGNFIGQTTHNKFSNKRVYLIGPCIVEGFGCVAGDSLNGHLQKLVTDFNHQVVSLSIEHYRWDRWEEDIKTIPIRENDIVLIVNQENWFPKGNRKCSNIGLAKVFNKPDRESMFYIIPIHTNSAGNSALAAEIFECYLKKEIGRLNFRRGSAFLQKGELLHTAAITEIKEYTKQIKKFNVKKIGAVVMNCNPFTYGHQYLIEYASKQMELVYVFVVEEDRSFFKFCDRYEMVQKGTKDLLNVFVVPSGKWVLSYMTMPVYFEKENKQDIKVDAQLDLEIFGRYIAPALGITKRFVGEEPYDSVTRQYNEQMAELLDVFNVELEVVPRKMRGDKVISASLVRKYMTNNNWEKLTELVPESSFRICNKYKEQKICF